MKDVKGFDPQGSFTCQSDHLKSRRNFMIVHALAPSLNVKKWLNIAQNTAFSCSLCNVAKDSRSATEYINSGDFLSFRADTVAAKKAAHDRISEIRNASAMDKGIVKKLQIKLLAEKGWLESNSPQEILYPVNARTGAKKGQSIGKHRIELRIAAQGATWNYKTQKWSV